MLEKSLDVLRNKELSFGCIALRDNIEITYPLITYNADHRYWIEGLNFVCADGDGPYHNEVVKTKNIVGNPLTRGRIQQLYYTHKITPHTQGAFMNIGENIKQFFLDNTELFDKTELERMQHDKWNELYPLLVEFSSYFNK